MRMKCLKIFAIMIGCCLAGAAKAQLQIASDKDLQSVFVGDARKITVVWHNAGDKIAEAEIRSRIIQTSSATAVQLGETPWKKLQILPQQTVIESVLLNFPAVKAETKFLVQWLADTNHMIGATDVLDFA